MLHESAAIGVVLNPDAPVITANDANAVYDTRWMHEFQFLMYLSEFLDLVYTVRKLSSRCVKSNRYPVHFVSAKLSKMHMSLENARGLILRKSS